MNEPPEVRVPAPVTVALTQPETADVQVHPTAPPTPSSVYSDQVLKLT